MRPSDSAGVESMQQPIGDGVSLALDDATVVLVRLAAVAASGDEEQLRAALAEAAARVDPVWTEELLLQSYLFAGLPRTLNAMREWRRISGRPAPAADDGADHARVDEWQARGEETCALVYGRFYERLRHNIAALHPALDAWMIVDGYGKVLARPGLDLVRRELCVVAACAALGQDRQLHSHLHGAVHVGATDAQVDATLEAIADLLPAGEPDRVARLWSHVRGR